jgi:hypothetical protein
MIKNINQVEIIRTSHDSDDKININADKDFTHINVICGQDIDLLKDIGNNLIKSTKKTDVFVWSHGVIL